MGAYMDNQQEDMQQSLQGTGIEVQRTSENTLNLTMPSNVTFAFDSADLTPQAQGALDSVAKVLNQYPDSTINVTGHTDDKGSDSYNQVLSERRAASVASYLSQHGVNFSRLTQQGMGEKMPKVPNVNEANRGQNRRVELAIVANKNAGALNNRAIRNSKVTRNNRVILSSNATGLSSAARLPSTTGLPSTAGLSAATRLSTTARLSAATGLSATAGLPTTARLSSATKLSAAATILLPTITP